MSGWFLWSTPQFDKSVQHQDHSFSAPKIRQFNTSNASVQRTRQFSTKNRQFNTEKSVIPTHWRFLWFELTLFCVELIFFVSNWRFLCVKLTGVSKWPFLCGTDWFWGGKGMALLCWTEKDLFYVMIIKLYKFKQFGYHDDISFNFNKKFSREWQTF